MDTPKPRLVDDRFLVEIEEREKSQPSLRGGKGGGTSDHMEARVTRLEIQMENVDRTLGSIDGKLDKVNDRLLLLPTKTDLNGWKLQWTALALAVVAIIIGGIIGGLAWIQPASAPATPIVVTMPNSQTR